MIALDTNILIYACDKADLKRQQIALDLVSNASDGVLLWQVACEFVAASRKLRYGPFAWPRARQPSARHCRDAIGGRKANGRSLRPRIRPGRRGRRLAFPLGYSRFSRYDESMYDQTRDRG